jgi:quercetin dioxygenase-like cupin family protein
MKTILIGVLLLMPTYLFAAGSRPIEVEQLVKTIASWDGSKLPSYGKGQAEVTIFKITIPVGGEVPWHIHPTINAGFIIVGRLTVFTDAGEKHELMAGDTIVEVVGKAHRGINSGVVPVELIVFYAGVEGKPLTIEVD